MSHHGLDSLSKRDESSGFLSNLFFVVPEPSVQKKENEVEMSSVVTSGNPGLFQKFNDIQGVSTFCFRIMFFLPSSRVFFNLLFQ